MNLLKSNEAEGRYPGGAGKFISPFKGPRIGEKVSNLPPQMAEARGYSPSSRQRGTHGCFEDQRSSEPVLGFHPIY